MKGRVFIVKMTISLICGKAIIILENRNLKCIGIFEGIGGKKTNRIENQSEDEVRGEKREKNQWELGEKQIVNI